MLIKKDIIELGWRSGLQVDLGRGLIEATQLLLVHRLNRRKLVRVARR